MRTLVVRLRASECARAPEGICEHAQARRICAGFQLGLRRVKSMERRVFEDTTLSRMHAHKAFRLATKTSAILLVYVLMERQH